MNTEAAAGAHWRRIGLIGGLSAAALVLVLEPPDGLSPQAWRVVAVAALMACWWLSEAIPLAATALLPLLLFPPLGIADFPATAAPYAHPLIFLFFGGFVIGIAMQRWNLHRRIALAIVWRVGTGQRGLVGGMMLASALISMWISNTATTLMMLPVAVSLLAVLARDDDEPLAAALLLGIAYAASIGGTATLIGTAPNAFFAGYMQQSHGLEIGFARWMLVGVPSAALLLVVAWWLLTRLAFRLAPAGQGTAPTRDALRPELQALGRMRREEWAVAAVFAVVALAWITRPLLLARWPQLGLTDAGIALAGALALFLWPADWRRARGLVDWEDLISVPWGVLILFGGGLALAAGIADTGLAAWLGESLRAFSTWPALLLASAVVALMVVLTELTSNTATTTTFLPIVAALAVAAGLAPVQLAAPAAVAASCAFMLPVATPPNAIVFGSQRLRLQQMLRAGVWLNLAAVPLIVLVVGTLAARVYA